MKASLSSQFEADEDIEESTSSDEVETKEPGECKNTEFQCCPDLHHPQHGYQGYGCCASSEFGCCPDNMTPAPAPFFDVGPKLFIWKSTVNHNNSCVLGM